MFTIDTDKTISVTRGDSGSFVAPINYSLQAGDVLRLKVFRKKACEDVVLQKDFVIGEATETVTLELTEQDTRFGEIISKPVDYWYEIELNPENNPQTLVGYDEEGAKIFRLYPEGRDLEDDELTEEEKETHRKMLEEFRGDIPEETRKYLDENIGLIAEEVEKIADFEKKENKLTKFAEVNNDDGYYSAKAVNEQFENLANEIEESLAATSEELTEEFQRSVNEKEDSANKLTAYSNSATHEQYYSAQAINEVAGQLVEDLDEKEDSANKVNSINDNNINETNYPTVNAVVEYVGSAKLYNEDSGNALKGEKAGNVLRIEDVSPIPHSISVQAQNKNLFDGEWEIGGLNTSTGENSSSTTAIRTVNFIPVEVGKSYYFTLGTDKTYFVMAYKSDYSFSAYRGMKKGSFVFVPSDTDCFVKIMQYSDVTIPENAQVEEGIEPTDYVPYVDLSTANFTAYGKNLIPYPYRETTKALNGIDYTDNGDGSITISGTSIGQSNFFFTKYDMKFKKGITYTLSLKGDFTINGTATLYAFSDIDGQVAFATINAVRTVTFTPEKDFSSAAIYIVIPAERTVSGTIRPQLEIGEAETDYELYKGSQEVTANENGLFTVNSKSPVTTIFLNEGVILKASYNRDINKAFAELQNAILSLGGNV